MTAHALTRRPLATLLLAAAYVAAGRLGIALDAVSGFAALVWAPTGLSLAALLLLGYGAWPGVAVGAFVVNLWAGAPLPAAAAIAAGNALEAVAAVWLLRRVPGFSAGLPGVRDVLSLIVLGAAAATTLSATVGVTSLSLAGRIAPGQLGLTWLSWWFGDATGALVVTPLVLTWAARGIHRVQERRAREALALTLALGGAAGLVFLRAPLQSQATFLQPYVLVAPLIWAALRFRTAGAATATFLVSSVAVAGTVFGLGPFRDGALYERLWGLQAFVGTIAVMFLVLGALAREHAESQQGLRRAKDVAEAASGAKSRFLAVMSHELRTPLTSVVGYADLLDSEISGSLGEAQRRYVGRIRVAAWHLLSIIEGILTFSRAEAGRDTIELDAVDTGAVAEEVVGLLEPQAVAKGLTLCARLRSPPVVRSDPGKIRQILLNLVSNAVKYSHQGSIELSVTSDGGAALFHVRDQGPGIPAHQLATIFEPFSQLQNKVTDVSTGTGLGLTIASKFAELLGGTLRVESVLGEGTTFTLKIPVEPGGPVERRPRVG